MTQTKKILSIEEAVELLKTNIPPRTSLLYGLNDAVGKYLAEDVAAADDSPRFTNSAMDGFCVRWEDLEFCSEENPVQLKIVGESQAGIPFDGRVDRGEAIKISTGAMIGDGCDTVIRVEDTKEADGIVTIFAASRQGQHLRYKGEEFSTGDVLLKKGSRISAPQAALLASIGRKEVKAYKPCRAGILVTGSELASYDGEIGDYQIRDSNMIMLKTAVEEIGAEVVSCVHVPDDAEETARVMASFDCDVIICTGGISVGKHDHVKGAASKNGFESVFWRIRQKPGKPLYFAKNDTQLLFGLPGNPVSAFMCFTHYVRPVLSNLNGLPFGWPVVTGEALADISNEGKRANMIRVKLDWRPNGGYGITSANRQGSHMLTSLSESDGYIILESGQTLKKNSRIDVYRYDFLREPV